MANPIVPILGKTGTLSIGATPTVIAGIKHIAHTGNKIDTEDVTDLSTPSIDKIFMATLRDNGSISIDGNYLPTDPGQAALAAAYGSAANTPFVVTYPIESGAVTATKDAFSGIVTSWNVDLQFEKYVTFKAEIKVSGAITTTLGA